MEQGKLAKIFKALANEQRLKILNMLYDWQGLGEGKIDEQEAACCLGVEKCFTKACCSLTLSRSTISHHFKELENAGLITVSRSGQSYVCKINPEAIHAIRDFLK